MERIITHITAVACPALGDVREMGERDVVFVGRSATARTDWPRIWDALAVAGLRGAEIHLTAEG